LSSLAHVSEEVVDFGEVVLFQEGVLWLGVSSSHRKVLHRYLIVPHPYRSTRGGIPEACYPVHRCMPKYGMRKTWAAAHTHRVRIDLFIEER
jgi:hypothetical protein